jgi:hypothetical protein
MLKRMQEEKRKINIAQVSKISKGEERIIYKKGFIIHPPYTRTCAS